MAQQFEDDEDQQMPDEQDGENVEFDDSDKTDVEDTDDGGAIVRLQDEAESKQNAEHFANIIEEVDQGELAMAINELIDKITNDKEAREKRDKQYEEGIRRTGLGDDAPGGAQFTGANKVVHPMLVEACVDFSARVMKEIFPANGPVKSKIVGEKDQSKVEKADRKTDFMNWQLTEQMVEFRGELEQLSTQLPLGGGQYMKFMWNPLYKRPMAEFVPIDDVYLPFAATNFYTAERKTHVQYVTKFEYDRRVKSGMYIDVDLGVPTDPEFSSASRANDKIEGRKDLSYNEDGLRTIFEVYTYLDFGDGPEPYILSIDKSTERGLSLYRNWEPDDEQRKELEWIVEFAFVPWRGAYPIGLTHMIGGLSGAATGALRALLDSAHIQNVPTLLKLKGGPGGQTLNVQPTEVVEMEGGALIDDVRKLAMPLPFNGPSPVLMQLLGFLVDTGKGVVQTTFEKLSDQNPNQPVGTTMALIEQGMVVFNSIHSRLHSSMARSLKILHRINSAYLTIEDIKAQESGIDIEPSDFDGPMDIIPVSDPAIFSETQRFAQIQAIMQRSQIFPQLYDMRKVEEMFLRTLKVPSSEVLKPKPAQDDMDPASENVAAAMGSGIYVLPQQDHMAHIITHMAFVKSPLFGSNPVIAKTFLFPMVMHLRDHLLNYYLTEAHDAVDKAQKQQLIPEEAQNQVQVILQVQQFIEQQMNGFSEQLQEMDKQAEQFKPQPQLPPDHALEIAQMSAGIQQKALDQKAQTDQARLQLDQIKLQTQSQSEQAKIAAQQQERADKLQSEQARIYAENQRAMAEIQAREAINTADNNTAKLITAAELEHDSRTSLTTGTGINFNP
jgi:chaperonin GroES